MGPRNTGGYSVNVDKIAEEENRIVVFVTESSPGKDCIVTQAITYPYQIVKIKKTDKEIVFKTKQDVRDCV